MAVLQIQPTNKLYDFMEKESVFWVHFGYSRKCLDPIMAPIWVVFSDRQAINVFEQNPIFFCPE